jgi:hypothetical protein
MRLFFGVVVLGCARGDGIAIQHADAFSEPGKHKRKEPGLLTPTPSWELSLKPFDGCFAIRMEQSQAKGKSGPSYA